MKRRTREEEKIAKRRQRAATSLVAAPKSFALGAMPGILPFQREWLGKAFAADVDLGALSASRGSGKSTLAGWVAACAVAPQGSLHEPGGAVLIIAPTTSQGREVLLAARHFLEGVDDLRWRDSASNIGVRHVPTNAELRILAASSTSLLGYGAHAGVIAFDEVGAAGAKGRAVFDAMLTSLGKRPGQRLVALGTRSPSGPSDWWPKWLSATAGQSRNAYRRAGRRRRKLARSGRSGEGQSAGGWRASSLGAGPRASGGRIRPRRPRPLPRLQVESCLRSGSRAGVFSVRIDDGLRPARTTARGSPDRVALTPAACSVGARHLQSGPSRVASNYGRSPGRVRA